MILVLKILLELWQGRIHLCNQFGSSIRLYGQKTLFFATVYSEIFEELSIYIATGFSDYSKQTVWQYSTIIITKFGGKYGKRIWLM